MSTFDGWVTRLGFLLGVVAVAAVGWTTRLPQASGTVGADVTVSAASTGELSVSPAGPFVRGLGLEPGRSRHAATGSITVHNSTATATDVQVRLLRSIHDLDALLHVDVTAGGTRIYSGPLGGLQSWSATTFPLDDGADARVTVSASVPAAVRGGYQSRIADLTLELRRRPAGA